MTSRTPSGRPRATRDSDDAQTPRAVSYGGAVAMRYPDKFAGDPERPESELTLPPALEAVLTSDVRLELLCQLEDGPATAPELGEHMPTLTRRMVLWHLNQLADMGWVHAVSVEWVRGGGLRTWDLTDRSVSWREFLAATKAAAPQPVPPGDDE